MTSSFRDPSVPWMLRVHSATGIAPLSAFFALHLWINARATQGRRAYETWAYAIHAIPGRAVFEALFIELPLAFHAVYGVLVVLDRVPGYPEPPHVHPWSRSMERVTGIAALLFIGFHVMALRVPLLLGELVTADLHPKLAAELSTTNALGVPLAAVAYLLGLAASAYHLANGVSRFCLRAGLGETERARRVLSLSCTLLGSVSFFIGANTVVYFATGAPLVDTNPPATTGAAIAEKRV
ncbi:MAG TPA: succinate dehydrogenase [Polyangiaceae bacterium]|nr:succinate dehydrogenase [Polyangiaceae bacterium]